MSEGSALPSDYTYSIAAGGTQVFTLTYQAPSPAVNLDVEISITSNDAYSTIISLPVHVQASVANLDPNGTPLVTMLEGNYPNPFNPETAIRFSTKEPGNVRLSVFNVKGQLIRTLVNGDLPSGNHRIIWNGKDSNGSSVSSGMYLYRMETPGYNKTLKMMLMK